MYLEFYKFKNKPFQINTDPKLHWFGESNTKIFKLFSSFLTDENGIALLTGESGTGKTTMINLITATLPENYFIGVTHDASFSPLEFSKYIAYEFNLKTDFESIEDFYTIFKKFSKNAIKKNKHILLVIDEVQNIPQTTLDMVYTLSKMNPLMKIILCGHSDFSVILMKSKNNDLKKALKANVQLQFLSEEETKDYILFKLKSSGALEHFFTKKAFNKIFYISKGSPLRINTIADYALLSGYINNTYQINEDFVEELTVGLDAEQLWSPNSAGADYNHTGAVDGIKHNKPHTDSERLYPASKNLFRFHSNDLRVLKQMVRFHIENKNFEEAGKFLEIIFSNHRVESDTLIMQGEIHLLKKQYDDAVEIFEKILSTEPKNVRCLYYKALALIEQKQFSSAKNSLEVALALNPKFKKGESLLHTIV